MREQQSTDAPSIGRVAAVAVFGSLVVVAGAFTTIGRVVLVIAAVVLILVLGVGIVVRSQNRRKFPPIEFFCADVSAVETYIDDARSRLAHGDSAAFGIHPANGGSDAEGQIWLFGAGEGRLERVAIELSLPESSDSSSRSPDLKNVLGGGWEIQSAQPHEWVLLTRSDLVDVTGLVGEVVDGLVALFDVPASAKWICQAVT